MIRNLQIDPTNSFRCEQGSGKHRCTGVCLIPVNMLERAQLRTGTAEKRVPDVEFTCGHKDTVTIVPDR